ncbi:acyltransferase [Thiorhodococcus mannitoliphagus]|uniref:Acyltransferase n=1 Tax=Thiorhodococcus mannitoliphagus TaxID=329406 RepID=A0A6P1DVK5_9GAMM|nr:acyltransferase [Thiorhodococcus mannitoliphagus]NEX19685.1 acyltransferase [Thiorhodococcus mannitoliphagus]
MTTPRKKRAAHVKGFDGVRGIAALIVVIHHSIVLPLDLAALAVFVFFVLSGFLITNILSNERIKMEQGRSVFSTSLKNFWTRRALRIFPAYYVALLLTMAMDTYLLGGTFYRDSIWYLAYLQNFFIVLVTHSWGIFTHTWSLAVEQQFYVFLAPLLLAIPSRHHSRAVALLFGLCLVSIYALWLGGAGEGLLYLFPFTGIAFALSGGFVSLNRDRLPTFLGRTWTLAVCLTAMPLLVAPDLDIATPLKYMLLMVAATGFIAHLVARPASILIRLLETKPLIFLGKVSYSLYILHFPLRVLLGQRLPETIVANQAVFLAIVIVVSVLAASASYYLVETRFLALIKVLRVVFDSQIRQTKKGQDAARHSPRKRSATSSASLMVTSISKYR